MSNQKIDPHLRHALWLAGNRRCVYCSEPLTFTEVDIDHVIPESLADKPELADILTKLGFPPDFDLMAIENLLPTHRRCNLAKRSDVFDEGSARFFLQQAQKVSTKVRDLISSRMKRENRDNVLSTVSQAFRSGLIEPIDIQDMTSGFSLRLTKPLVFADRSEERIESISPDEVEGFLDRPVLIGGNPIFAADFGDDDAIRMTVRTCREYRAALAAGFYAKTTYDIKSEAFLRAANSMLTAAASLRMPLTSFIRTPYVGLADLDLLPSSLLPCVSPDDDEQIKALGPLSLGDLSRRSEIRLLDVASGQISLEWRSMGLMLREIGRADFDSDGIEDILCECYCWATEGTLGFGWTDILARTDEHSRFMVTRR